MSSKPTWWGSLAALGLGALGIGALGIGALTLGSCARQPKRSSLVLITTDTTRADHLSVYGYAEPTTPALERLGSQSIRFERAFSHVPITLPAHTSIMTGTFPTYHGVRDNGRFVVRQGLETLAERLAAEGYRTAAFVSAFVLDSRYGLDQGFEVYDDDYGADWSEEDLRDVRIYNNMVIDRRADQTTARAVSWLESAGDDPFFLWVHYYDPHQRYDPPAPYRELFGSLYDGEIAFMDAQIGELVAALEILGRWDDAAVVVVGDHGEGLGEHEEVTHAMLVYDSTLRVPLLIKPPENRDIEPGVVEMPVSHVDLRPTMLELLGLAPGTVGQGRSLVDLMRGGKESAHPAYFECLLPHFGHDWEPLFGIRRDSWKYIQAPQPELYDLESDPTEIYNLVELEPDRTAELEAELFRIVEATTVDSTAGAASLDAETRAKLEALGYTAGSTTLSNLNPREPTGRMSTKEGIMLLGDWFVVGTLASQGRMVEAALLLETVLLPLDPTNPAFILRLAELKRRLGAPDRAYELLQRAQTLRPEDAQVLQLLGQLEMDRENLAEALELLRAANQLSPGSLHGLYLEALAVGRAGDHERSATLYREALAIDGSHRDSLINLGGELAQLGELEPALASLVAARQLAPWYARTHYNIGLVERLLNRPEASREALARALELRQRYPEARLALGVTLIESGEFERGRQELLRLEQEEPGSAAAERARATLESLQTEADSSSP